MEPNPTILFYVTLLAIAIANNLLGSQETRVATAHLIINPIRHSNPWVQVHCAEVVEGFFDTHIAYTAKVAIKGVTLIIGASLMKTMLYPHVLLLILPQKETEAVIKALISKHQVLNPP